MIKASAPPARSSRANPHRKNPRLLANLLSQGRFYCEDYFQGASLGEVLQLFKESYCSSLVNFLLDLKKSTTKQLFEMVVQHKRRAFLDVITMYYYRDYLINPFPLTLETEEGKEVPNHYAILGLPREAAPDELKEAHKLLLMAFRTASFPPADRRTGEERLREIEAAFMVLKNPKRRKVIDDELPNISYLYPRRDQSWFEAVHRLVQ